MTDKLILQVCNTLWSLAALGALDSALLQRMGARLLELDAPATLSLPEAKQLLLVRIACFCWILSVRLLVQQSIRVQGGSSHPGV